MWSSRETALIQRYSEEIQQEYRESSRVPLLARIQRESNAEAPNFMQFGKRFRIPREFFEESHLIIVRPFAQFIERSEYQYLIDMLRDASINITNSRTEPDIEMIDRAIASISGQTQADFIIIPIAFYVTLHRLSRESPLPVIQYEHGHAYYNHFHRRLRILWSNKFIDLNEIIIGNSRDSSWLFKSANGNNRLTVRFDLEETGANAILLVRTVFQYHPPLPENILVIRFPASLCRIE